MANNSEALGKCYAAMIAGELLAEYPDHLRHHHRCRVVDFLEIMISTHRLGPASSG